MSDQDHLAPLSATVRIARVAFLSEFQWRTGHADVWRVFANGNALAAVVAGLADPWRDSDISHVVGIESRGFLLGAAVAVELGVGFQAIRKGDGLLPGPKLSVSSAPDYMEREYELRMQDTLIAGDVALLVDDWAERGSQATAVRELVEKSGAHFAGVSLLVDQLHDEVRTSLGRVTSLVRASELMEPGES